MCGALAEGTTIGLLADERDHAGAQIARERFEALGAGCEVTQAQVSGARCRPVGGVRDADAKRKQVELLGGLEQPRREPGRLEKAPEVVAGVRKVRSCGIREATGIDPAENDGEARGEDVGNGGRRGRRLGYAASGSRASRRASNASRIRSVKAEGDSMITGSPGWTTLTVSSLPLKP